jgi:enterochelin esterase-like enzyme
MLAQSTQRPGLKFWLQTGTEDENEDRNKNGVIDSIDDTLDVIRALQHLGYREGDDIHYLEVIGGEHNLPTWARVMPDFLQWAFGQQT